MCHTLMSKVIKINVTLEIPILNSCFQIEILKTSKHKRRMCQRLTIVERDVFMAVPHLSHQSTPYHPLDLQIKFEVQKQKQSPLL